jgi:pyruvate/2-oxoglutarate dehydrogenase complex dihydrolipoamide dehydrogenase (E3) component
MIILGGGPIGSELAQTFYRLGVHVTILQRGDQLLPKEDRDVAHFLERCLVVEGVRIVKNADAHSAAASDAGKVALQLLDRQPRNDRCSRSASESVRPAELTFFSDALLIAIGRTPNLRSLDLKAAGVEFGEKEFA